MKGLELSLTNGSRFRARRSAVLAAAMVVGLTGCAGVIPIPPSSNTLISGRVIRKSDAAFIRPGLTTRRGVEQGLGKCTRDNPRARAIAYTWEKPAWTMVWFVTGPYSGQNGNFPVGGWFAIFIAFDGSDRVAKMEFVTLSHRRSLDEQMVRWSKRIHGNKP